MSLRFVRSGCSALVAFALFAGVTASAAGERPLFVSLGDGARAPIGWIDFCARYASECDSKSSAPRDVVLTAQAWKDLVRVNKWANETIKPVTDLEHWGSVEQWDLPNDGKGDCEDYALLKRKMLIKAGWPREALLMTVVREKNGDGHAVLTVKTDKGEFVLDNQHPEVLIWSETAYRFVKRQSQSNPNQWVALGDARPTTSTASAR
jgi:predicted transglutaminase-like cysteine proteinase